MILAFGILGAFVVVFVLLRNVCDSVKVKTTRYYLYEGTNYVLTLKCRLSLNVGGLSFHTWLGHTALDESETRVLKGFTCHMAY